jgi:carbon monoxide dehydrogenase subunit G
VRLDHSFVVPVPASRAWAALLDGRPEQPLVSELTITSREADRFAGTLRVRVGPITLCYRGSGRYVVRDRSALRLLIEAAGQDVHGGGTAAATVRATLRENPNETTRVEVRTELVMTGRLMQGNRRLVQAAGARLAAQFADALLARVAAAEAGHEPARVSPPGGPRGAAPSPRGLRALVAPRRLRSLVPYLCAFLLGGLLTLAVLTVLG